jgi:hypothetical protein
MSEGEERVPGWGDSEGQGMTVGGRWRKEGSALAAPAAAVAV